MGCRGAAAPLSKPTDAIYEAEYFQTRRDPRRREMMFQEFHRLPWRSATSVLDIGCGTGEFLTQFPLGRRLYGIEPSRHGFLLAKRKGISFDLPAGDDWADLVVMRGVLQHLPFPESTLCDAYNWLKPGGTLAILATPNAGSLHYRIHKTLPALDPPRNHHVYSAKELGRALTGIGYQDLRFHFPYLRTPYAHPVRDVARFLCGKQTAFPRNMMEVFASKPL
jgi:SAM-dependent methyltransferase